METRSKALRIHVAESKEPRVVSGQGEIREENQARPKATGDLHVGRREPWSRVGLKVVGFFVA